MSFPCLSIGIVDAKTLYIGRADFNMNGIVFICHVYRSHTAWEALHDIEVGNDGAFVLRETWWKQQRTWRTSFFPYASSSRFQGVRINLNFSPLVCKYASQWPTDSVCRNVHTPVVLDIEAYSMDSFFFLQTCAASNFI